MKNNVWNIDRTKFFEQKSLQDKIKFLLKYAVLAPSVHNAQPWLFQIEERSCKVFLNPELSLKEADPSGRDRYISIGCCLENLVIAAKYFNVFESVYYHCNEKENLVVEVFFREGNGERIDNSLEYLISAITKRFNARGMFQDKHIDQKLMQSLKGIEVADDLRLDFISDKEKIKELGELTMEGIKLAHGKGSFRREMSRWMHNNLSNAKDGLPGYSLRMPAFLSFIIPVIIRFFDFGKFLGKKSYEGIASAPLLVVLSAQKDSCTNWLNVGRLGERIMLECIHKDAKVSVYVAAIEIDELHLKVQEVIGTTFHPQFLLCIGYMDIKEWQTPRHSVEEKIVYGEKNRENY